MDRIKEEGSDTDEDAQVESGYPNLNLEEEIAKIENINLNNVKRGMFVSGWDDPDELIIEDKNPEASSDRLILHAAENGDLATVRQILEVEPECVNATDDDGYTPLHRAAYGNHKEVAEELLKYNANINALTAFKWTPLHSACKWNNADMAALLLQHGADVNALSEGLQTPLHVAATVSDCRETVATLLLNENIKPELLNNSGETAAAIARRTGASYPIFDMGRPGLRVQTGMLSLK